LPKTGTFFWRAQKARRMGDFPKKVSIFSAKPLDKFHHKLVAQIPVAKLRFARFC